VAAALLSRMNTMRINIIELMFAFEKSRERWGISFRVSLG
jgi:hypothetical protein